MIAQRSRRIGFAATQVGPTLRQIMKSTFGGLARFALFISSILGCLVQFARAQVHKGVHELRSTSSGPQAEVHKLRLPWDLPLNPRGFPGRFPGNSGMPPRHSFVVIPAWTKHSFLLPLPGQNINFGSPLPGQNTHFCKTGFRPLSLIVFINPSLLSPIYLLCLAMFV